MMDKLCMLVEGISPTHLLLSVLVQHLLAVVWFNFIVKNLNLYCMAADKGVRRAEHVLQLYSPCVVTCAFLATAALRATVALALLNLLKANSVMDYEHAAIATALMPMIWLHRFFACQRPLPLLITEYGYEIAAAMSIVWTSYALTQYKM